LEQKILFVHNLATSFVQLDLQCLRQVFPVTEFEVRSHQLRPVDIWNQVSEHQLVFAWFASWHSFLPILFARWQHKPSILVIGGYDLANLPEAEYGNQRGGLKRWVSLKTMHTATRLMTNSYYSQLEAEKNAGIPARNIQVIYHGIPDPFGKLPEKKEPKMALSVGNVERENLLRKGHLPFAQTARVISDVPFVLVGRIRDESGEMLKQMAGNLELTGWISQTALEDTYRRAWVYIQASLHEGFGMSLAEAMLAGCIPVTSNSGAIPEVVGDTGLYIDPAQPKSISQAVLRAFEMPAGERWRARQRILDEFPLTKRAEKLNKLVNESLIH
jgi:glycosyltransferase involved in cell wall biosynthesis